MTAGGRRSGSPRYSPARSVTTWRRWKPPASSSTTIRWCDRRGPRRPPPSLPPPTTRIAPAKPALDLRRGPRRPPPSLPPPTTRIAPAKPALERRLLLYAWRLREQAERAQVRARDRTRITPYAASVRPVRTVTATPIHSAIPGGCVRSITAGTAAGRFTSRSPRSSRRTSRRSAPAYARQRGE